MDLLLRPSAFGPMWKPHFDALMQIRMNKYATETVAVRIEWEGAKRRIVRGVSYRKVYAV